MSKIFRPLKPDVVPACGIFNWLEPGPKKRKSRKNFLFRQDQFWKREKEIFLQLDKKENVGYILAK